MIDGKTLKVTGKVLSNPENNSMEEYIFNYTPADTRHQNDVIWTLNRRQYVKMTLYQRPFDVLSRLGYSIVY